MKKILKTLSIIALGLMIGGVAYTFNQQNTDLLKADLSDALPEDITWVEFADPSGSITPSNGIVTINSVDYETSTPSDTGTADQSDILASSITFVATTAENCAGYSTEPACPLNLGCEWTGSCTPITGAGVQVSGNEIIVPSGHYPVNIDIHTANGERATGTYTMADAACIAAETYTATISGTAVTYVATTSDCAGNDASDTQSILSGLATAIDTNATVGPKVNAVYTPNTITLTATSAGIAGNYTTLASDTSSSQTLVASAGSMSGGVNPVILNSNPLYIHSLSCENLQMQILRGQGSGTYTGSETLPTAASSYSFDFDPSDPDDAINSIVISNPVAAETGQQTFAITFNFVDTLEEEKAVITSSTGDGSYEVSVKDEGTDTVATSENFVYAVNDVLGLSAPFIAVLEADSKVYLITKELGTHTNDYGCMMNNANYPDSTIPPYSIGKCFAGATDGTVDVLTQPLTMDSTLTQGDTVLVYAAGSVGVTEWGTSHSSVLEVVPFGEIGETGGGGTVQFIPASYVEENVPQISKSSGSYDIDCTTEYDDSDLVNITSQECTIDFSIPVTYDPENDFDTIVYIGDEEIDVPVTLQTGSTGTLVGTVTGSATYNYNTGLNSILEGTISGVVKGNATGEATGLVTGSVAADVTVSVDIDPGVDLLTSVFESELSAITATVGTIDAEGDMISTVELINTDAGVTNYAILYAKRAGTSILTVTDALSCVAALDIEVQKKMVILDMVGKDPSDVFELGESVQINAYLGSADGEIDENENITASSGIEWESSNPDVATIDQTGVLSIIAPGITNITATYYTGDAEIDPVESEPMTISVSKITGLTIALDEESQEKLTNSEIDEAYESVLIILNDPQAAGKTITVEGEKINITLPSVTPDYDNDLERIEAIIGDSSSGLIHDIEGIIGVPAPTVTTVVGLPGVIVLQPHADDENGRIDISTTASKENLTILPNFSHGINLPASETYGLMVIADYDNGRTKRLNTTDVTWVNTPLNYLEQTSLEAGIMKLGEITGSSTVMAKYENADGTVINSNQLSVEVGSGPEIEYARRVKSGSITQGSRINLMTKVTDVDTIADISEITTSIVRSDYSTYQAINSDSGAVWFTAETYIDEVTVESESTSSDSEDETETETSSTTLNYKTYNIPIEIPVDEYLYDGTYNLVLSISDASNHTSHYVLSIYIGEQASGDVSGDGEVGMVDVILAFQIATDPSSFTQQQLEAADMDHMGGVTMVDVILLFNQATSN